MRSVVFYDQTGFKNKKKNEVTMTRKLNIRTFDHCQFQAMKNLCKTLYLLLFLLIFSISCKKSTPAPDYPQLMGVWSGSTSQSQTIRVVVDNIGGTLYLTQIRFIVLFDSGGQQSIERNSTEGLASVNNRYFKYSTGTGIYGPAFVDGTFDLNSMTLSGTFKIYNPSNPNDYTTGTFVSSKTN
jgi:hypothetical protein